MSVVIIEDFNSYNDGNLNGQGGWSGETLPQVQGSVVQEGAKAVSVTDSSGARGIASKSITARTSNIIGAWLRVSAAMWWELRMHYNDIDTPLIKFHFAANAHASFFTDTSGSVDWGVVSVGEWHLFEVELDQANSRVRGRIDGGAWTEWQAQAFTSIGLISFDVGGDSTSRIGYLDHIFYDDQVPSFSRAPTMFALFCFAFLLLSFL